MATSPAIRYRVSMPRPAEHEFAVVMHVPAMAGRDVLEFVFPAWAPGSYMVRDFARNIYDLAFTGARGRAMPVERIDKQRWRVRTGGRPVRASYRIFAFEASVRTSFLDDTHAFWNGSSLFFLIDGCTNLPCEVRVDSPKVWRVSTALPGGGTGTRVWRATGYDELADSPFEVGTHPVHHFTVRRTACEVALYGNTNADVPRLLRELRKIVEATGKIFGGFPFTRYLFIIHMLPSRGGGLEHAASATLDIVGMGFEDEKAYQNFAALAAHEFFHAWNVKRIRDRVLGPFDYTRENYTRLLWFHEGFTSYMEGLLLMRAGLLSCDRYLADLADDWPRFANRPGRNATPLSELSFEAWIKQYRPAENHANRMVSYYEKGKWAALVLELLLRRSTGGQKGVVQLFQHLWKISGKRGTGIGQSDLRAAAEAIAGRSMGGFFKKYIDGTHELPVVDLLRKAGLVVRQPAPGEDEKDATKRARQGSWVGLVFPANATGDRAVVSNVVPHSPASAARLSFGDEIVAVNGTKVSAVTVAKRLADRAVGQFARITFFRGENLRSTSLKMAVNPERLLVLEIDHKAIGLALAVRRGWLGI